MLKASQILLRELWNSNKIYWIRNKNSLKLSIMKKKTIEDKFRKHKNWSNSKNKHKKWTKGN
jgi:phosphoribosyl-AMP cyclohydrolase